MSSASSASFNSGGPDLKPAQKSDDTTPNADDTTPNGTKETSDLDNSPSGDHILPTDEDFSPPHADNSGNKSSDTEQLNLVSSPAPDGDVPPQLPTPAPVAMNNDESNNNDTQKIAAHLPASFSAFMPGEKYYNGELALLSVLQSTLDEFGITRFKLGPGSHKNKTDETKDLYPHKRFNWICGACSAEQRKLDNSINGCCGFFMRLLLVEDKRDLNHQPHLEIKEFKLPSTSRHLQVSSEVWSRANNILNHEDQLTPTKTKLVKNLGIQRVNCATAANIISSQFDGLKVTKPLLHRLMRKGRDETWGRDESESMMIFYSAGLKLRDNVDPILGVAGKFRTKTGDSGELEAWSQQHPIEVLNARVYGQDIIWSDTTHNSTKYSLKTGPIGTVDWGGHTAPVGLLQVPEEEVTLLLQQMIHLELDVPEAVHGTDGGSAWPGLTEALDHIWVEDTFHNDKGSDKKLEGMSKTDKTAFQDKKQRALYNVMPESQLDEVLQDMADLATPSPAASTWVARLTDGKQRCCATYTTKYFICSIKGATSRCEQCQSRLKGAGTLKKVMKNWTLPELQERHLNIVNTYVIEAKEEIQKAIRMKRQLSEYVLEVEKEELNHVASLVILSKEDNVTNPFHGKLASSKGFVPIYAHKTNIDSPIGLTLTTMSQSNSLLVAAISDDSIFINTGLHVGMSVSAIHGMTFTSLDDGLKLLEEMKPGWFRVIANTVPSVGTLYEVSHRTRSDKKHKVFIPNKTTTGTFHHCQSDYRAHTTFWVRCRYIQRALMDHCERTIKDVDTIHKRWHLSNSPLYRIVLQEMKEQMHVSGLGEASLPWFIADATASVPNASSDNGNNNEMEEDRAKRRLTVPSAANKRHNHCDVVTKQIKELVKANAEVYAMVMPQLDQILENATFLHNASSSKKVQNSQAHLKRAGANLPVAPISFKRTNEDDVNGANLSAKKKKKPAKRRKRPKDDTAKNVIESTAAVKATSEVVLSNDKKCSPASGTGGVKQSENDEHENSSSDSDVVLSDLTTAGTRKSSRARRPTEKVAVARG